MSRSSNILLFLISLFTLLFEVLVFTDQTIFEVNLKTWRYTLLIYGIFAGILLLLIGLRSSRRWVGVLMTRKAERFIWSSKMDPQRIKYVRVFLIMEISVAAFLLAGLIFLDQKAWLIHLAYTIFIIDQFLFSMFAPKWFRTGITHKAVLSCDIEARVLWFSGLKRIHVQIDRVYFEYSEELVLFFPENCVEKGKYPEFRAQLKERINLESVYFDDKFEKLQ